MNWEVKKLRLDPAVLGCGLNHKKIGCVLEAASRPRRTQFCAHVCPCLQRQLYGDASSPGRVHLLPARFSSYYSDCRRHSYSSGYGCFFGGTPPPTPPVVTTSLPTARSPSSSSGRRKLAGVRSPAAMRGPWRRWRSASVRGPRHLLPQ